MEILCKALALLYENRASLHDPVPGGHIDLADFHDRSGGLRVHRNSGSSQCDGRPWHMGILRDLPVFDNVWSIDKMIRRGEMDVFLIRPASPFVQMLGQIMHFQAVLSMVVYVGILAWSIHGIGLSVGVREIVLLVEYVIFGTVINSGIYTIFNSLNFWIVQGDDIAVLVQTCREFVKYPLQVFPAAIPPTFCRWGLWPTIRCLVFLEEPICRS